MIEKLGAIITSASLLSGCTAGGDYYLVPDLSYPEVTSTDFPDNLPTAVTEQIPNVVSVLGSIPLLGKTEVCSGVRIDRYDYLSAGHCDYSLSSDALPLCVDMTIHSPVSESDKNGIALPTTKKAGHYEGDTSGITRGDINTIPNDTLLLETPFEPRPYTTPTRIGDLSKITTGMPLYLVNFEPTEEGMLRSPNSDYLTEDEVRSGLTKPAILGAIALKQYANGMVAAIGGLKAYSEPPDTNVRGGASGGPVYNEEGDLVGTAINLIDFSSIFEVEQNYGISIPEISSQSTVNVFLVQNISESSIADLQEQQQPTQSC